MPNVGERVERFYRNEGDAMLGKDIAHLIVKIEGLGDIFPCNIYGPLGRWRRSAARSRTLFFSTSFNIRFSSLTRTVVFLNNALASKIDSASLRAVLTPPISSRKFSFTSLWTYMRGDGGAR